MLLGDESHIFSLFIMSATLRQTNPIDNTILIHFHMVSYHTIIAFYCIIVTP